MRTVAPCAGETPTTTGKTLILPFRSHPECPALPAKIFFFAKIGTQAHNHPVPRPLPRAYRDRHDTWCGMRWTREVRQANAPRAYGQAVWSWSPDAGIKSVETRFRPCGRNAEIDRRRRLTSPVLRREHEVSRKAIAQGMPDCSALPDLLVCVLSFLHTRLRVRPAPGIPCTLCFGGDVGRARTNLRRGDEES
jgi:hypothetical protein